MSLALNAAAWFFVGQADDTGAPRSLPIKPPFRIGRNSGLELSLPSRSVSGQHAKIVEEDGELWLHDLGSTNGTFVNGKRVTSKTRLCEGDMVQFAATVFRVTHQSSTGVAGGFADPQNKADAIEKIQTTQFDRLFNGGVVPFFQPIIRIDNQRQTVYGYEVLGRSRLFGLRTPEQMFAAASRLEMEAELSRVLRRQGIEVAAKGLPDHLSLFVNTHPAELVCDGLIDSLLNIRRSQPNRPITLEVHESVLNNSHQAAELRAALRELEIRLAFYDFGAGQSRLVELSDVSPDVLKFDVNLISGIHKAPAKRQNFVASLVKMIMELGITPLAEHVEDQGEHETLCQLGFEMAQGFLYGKPCSLPDCVVSTPVSGAPAKKQTCTTTSNSKPDQSSNSSASPASDQSVNDSAKVSNVESPKNAQWLLSQSPHQYTIQVLSAISLERAKQHVQQQDNPRDFAIFRKQGKTRMLYIVVSGIYEDRSAAKAVSAKLALTGVSPWVRMLSGVHAEINTTQQAGN